MASILVVLIVALYRIMSRILCSIGGLIGSVFIRLMLGVWLSIVQYVIWAYLVVGGEVDEVQEET